MNEIWRPISDLEGEYEISNLGRVRNLPRVIVRGGRVPLSRIKGRVRKATLNTAGYMAVSLRGKQRNVHVLVAEAFHGPRPEGMYACHNNGDPTDNRAENLRWDTPSANQRDRIKHGRGPNMRTHCKNGHEFTKENTYWTPRGHRSCRTCGRESTRRSAARRAARQPVDA